MKFLACVERVVEAEDEEEAKKKALERLSVEDIEVYPVEEKTLIVLCVHRNVDLDAILSIFLYLLKDEEEVFEEKLFYDYDEGLFLEYDSDSSKTYWITTEEFVRKVVSEVATARLKLVILDMPMKNFEDLLNKVDEFEHYDHHDGSAPSTAQILWDTFKDKLPEWVEYLVELANFADTGRVLKQEAPMKYFHLTGYINALRTYGYTDIQVIEEIFRILVRYKDMLIKLENARKELEKIPIYDVGKYKVAIVENAPHTVNQALFEHENVDLIIFKDGNNLGITRNALVNEPDLNKLKPIIESKLKEKGKPEEVEEWFFHPAGFLVARGTRKHPAKTPSTLTAEDLLEILKELIDVAE